MSKRKTKKKIDLSKYGLMATGCVWCDEIFIFLSGGSETNNMLRGHVLYHCKKHPMRKLERKIKRLEKKR